MRALLDGQCEASTRESLRTERCTSDALPGSRWCAIHGKNAARHVSDLRSVSGGANAYNTTENLPTVYRKILSRSLREAIDSHMHVKLPQEHLQLYEELALMRHSALATVALYDAAVNADECKPETVESAASLMRGALREVAQMAKSAAQVEALAQDKLSLQQLGVIVEQIVRLAYEVFGDEHAPLVEQFARAVNDRVKVPVIEARGTASTPDQDAADMDATIPRCIDGPPPPVDERDDSHHTNGRNGR